MTDLLSEEGQRGALERVKIPQAPGAESVGPPITDLVVATEHLRRLAEALGAQARAEAREREYPLRGSVQLDANGDGALLLFEVPQGATGYLTWLAIDMAGVTPAAPVTSANLWHGIFGGPSGEPTAAQIVQVGALLDCEPKSPAADAQLPSVYVYGSKLAAPTLVGPEAFYLVIDAATAARQVGVRGKVVVVQPEP